MLPREWVERMHSGKTKGTHVVYDETGSQEDDARFVHPVVHIFHPVMWAELRLPVPFRGVLCAAPSGSASPLAVFNPVTRACRLVLNPSLLVAREADCVSAKAKCLDFLYANEFRVYKHVYDNEDAETACVVVNRGVMHVFQAWALYASTLHVDDWDAYDMTDQDFSLTVSQTILGNCVYASEAAGKLGMIRAHASAHIA